MTRAEAEAIAIEREIELVFFDGFDDAIVGIASRFGMEPVVLYDRAKCLAKLVRDGMSDEDAEEWMSFNVEGAWVGKQTPLFLLWPDAL